MCSEKLEETDISGLDDAKKKAIELKMRRCKNGEKLMEKEMYLIKARGVDYRSYLEF